MRGSARKCKAGGGGQRRAMQGEVSTETADNWHCGGSSLAGTILALLREVQCGRVCTGGRQAGTGKAQPQMQNPGSSRQCPARFLVGKPPEIQHNALQVHSFYCSSHCNDPGFHPPLPRASSPVPPVTHGLELRPTTGADLSESLLPQAQAAVTCRGGERRAYHTAALILSIIS